jgi:hypothetical protein
MRDQLIGPNGVPFAIVIGCGRSKRQAPDQARSLYVSRRFKTCRLIAEALQAPYFILSARHGVVNPEARLEPYDLDLKTLSSAAICHWARAVLDSLEQSTDGQGVTVLAEEAYARPVLTYNAHRNKPLPVAAPLADLDPQFHQQWLEQALARAVRIRDMRKLYTLIDVVRRHGGTFKLRELSRRKLPLRGVYVFLDSNEQNFLGYGPRIVRIGTHAVSIGSKSSLKGRLRNHLGLSSGSGNHRGSVFRLHVGRAMLAAERSPTSLLSWGVGQDTDAGTRAAEEQHERRVSEYLRDLEVFIIPIEDPPAKDSLRAFVERQLIALCSEGLQPIDTPHFKWLGLKSPQDLSSRTGLWNLRDVGRQYVSAGPGAVDHIASLLDLDENVEPV